MGGDKHDSGHLLRAHVLQHRKPIHLRHLHIQKNQVGPNAPDCFHSLASVSRLVNRGDIGIARQQDAQPFARQWSSSTSKLVNGIVLDPVSIGTGLGRAKRQDNGGYHAALFVIFDR